LGAQSYDQDSLLGGKPAISIGIYQPGANALDVDKQVRVTMGSKNFPSASLQVVYEPNS
jgi:multidrug efflux pump subunit AcrB